MGCRAPAIAERDRVQLGEPVAAAGVAKPDWQLVVDQPAAAVGENGRPTAETRPLLLVTTG